jgi:hypothetical protein
LDCKNETIVAILARTEEKISPGSERYLMNNASRSSPNLSSHFLRSEVTKHLVFHLWTMTLSPLAPLSQIQIAPLTRDDLILEKPDDFVVDEVLLEAFEAAWIEHLNKPAGSAAAATTAAAQPPPLQGRHEERILKLQQEAEALKQSKDSVEAELKRQAAFLRASRDEMEASFTAKLQQAADEQAAIRTKLTCKLDSVAMTSTLAQSTVPWLQFVSKLDECISSSDSPNNHPSPEDDDWSSKIGIGKPSARALFLARSLLRKSDGDNKASSDAPFTMQQLQSAAYRIDQVLLKRHVQMLEAEIDRYERLGDLHPDVGVILNEARVWDILPPPQQPLASDPVKEPLIDARAASTLEQRLEP